MPSSVLLQPQDYRRMPWKNGLGETIEMAICPPQAGIDDFDWRISMATVASDGPFSLFTGVDRTLSVLSGEGLSLHREDGTAVPLLGDSEPYSFPADEQVEAKLADGAITDLNVMTRRGRFAHTVERLSLDEVAELPARQNTVLIFCLKGQALLTVETETKRLAAGESLMFPENAPGSVLSGRGLFFVIDLLDRRDA